MRNIGTRAACLHDASLPSAKMKVLLPTQVQSNGVLDQLVRKWTTDIDQCRGDQVCVLYEALCCCYLEQPPGAAYLGMGFGIMYTGWVPEREEVLKWHFHWQAANLADAFLQR